MKAISFRNAAHESAAEIMDWMNENGINAERTWSENVMLVSDEDVEKLQEQFPYADLLILPAIRTMSGLCDYINENGDWMPEINDIIAYNGWEEADSDMDVCYGEDEYITMNEDGAVSVSYQTYYRVITYGGVNGYSHVALDKTFSEREARAAFAKEVERLDKEGERVSLDFNDTKYQHTVRAYIEKLYDYPSGMDDVEGQLAYGTLDESGDYLLD